METASPFGSGDRRNGWFPAGAIRCSRRTVSEMAIQGNLEAIEAGLRPVLIARRPYVPYKKHPKYTGFMALYVHYLYLLGKIKKREYPPKMTPHLKAEIMKFEKYKAQFKFLHENHITGPEAAGGAQGGL